MIQGLLVVLLKQTSVGFHMTVLRECANSQKSYTNDDEDDYDNLPVLLDPVPNRTKELLHFIHD
jgi:hypothetical protein